MKFFDTDDITAGSGIRATQQIALGNELRSKGKIEEAVHQYAFLLKAVDASIEKAFLYNLLAITFVEQGRHDKAIVCFEEALRIARETDKKAMQAKLLANIGSLYERESRWKQAQESYSKSFEIFENLGMRDKAMAVRQATLDTHAAHTKATAIFSGSKLPETLTASDRLNRLGQLHLDVDDFETAVSYFKHAEKSAQEEGNLKLLATVLNNMAVASKRQHQYDHARECYEQSIALCEQVSDLKNLGTTWNNLGVLLRENKDYERAIEAFNESLKIKEQTSDIESTANTLFNLAKLHLERCEFEKAQKFVMRAIEIDKKLDPNALKEDEALLKEIKLKMRTGY